MYSPTEAPLEEGSDPPPDFRAQVSLRHLRAEAETLNPAGWAAWGWKLILGLGAPAEGLGRKGRWARGVAAGLGWGGVGWAGLGWEEFWNDWNLVLGLKLTI